MRTFVLIIFALIASPALAQGWDRYDNARFGYSIAIPPGFYGAGESENGDGQAFKADGKPSFILVWGGNLMGGFDAGVADAMQFAQDENWNITYQAATPEWASFSGSSGSRIFYQRMILLCDRTSYASFLAEYSVADRIEMDAVVEQLVLNLRGTAC